MEALEQIKLVLKAAWSHRQGYNLLTQEAFAEAEPFLQEAVDLKPRKGLYHSDLGQCLLKLGREKEAEKHLRKGYELAPWELRTNVHLTRFLIEREDYEEANDVLQHMLFYVTDEGIDAHAELCRELSRAYDDSRRREENVAPPSLTHS